MATWRQIVYQCLDQIKAISNDSIITEDHVIFMASQYRTFLLEQKKKADGLDALSSSNQQTICLNLERSDLIPDLDYCNEEILKSIEEIPDTIDSEASHVYTANYFDTRITYVSKERFKFIGFNKWMKNIIYVTLGPDNHLYFKGNNPQFLYMTQAKMTAVFEDAEKAAEYACEKEDGSTCDILDQDFPLDSSLIPQLLELVVKLLVAAEWRQADEQNNSADDLASLIAYIRQNIKSPLARQLSI